MNRDKILIIKKNPKSTIFFKINDIDVEQYYKCKTTNIFFRIIRKLKLNMLEYFLGDWKKKIKKYRTIILFDNGFVNFIPKFIKNKNKNVKIILWFWNPINVKNEYILENEYIDEIWSYDKNDVDKYKIKYNTQFYTKNIKCPDNKIEQDIIFVGKDKGRKQTILNLQDLCQKNNIKMKTYIIEKEKDYISYEQYINYLSESKAILEIVNKDIKGLTLRTMESIFLNKKLITNNQDIINYDFYNQNNIFILGKDNINNIKQFINLPYKNIENKIIDYYDFDSWLERIDTSTMP